MAEGVVAQVPGQLGNLAVVGRDHAALARGDDLVAVEAKAGGIAQPAGAPPLVLGAVRFGRILNHQQAVLLGQRPQRVHVGGVAVDVHRDDRPRAAA